MVLHPASSEAGIFGEMEEPLASEEASDKSGLTANLGKQWSRPNRVELQILTISNIC